MKFFHISDLHLGKRVNEFSMIEDQKYILIRILNAIDEEKPDAVIIAGDVYDKSVPSAEAVEVFDEFLFRLSKKNLQVFVISGNHDSPERLAFGNRLMEASGIHISSVYNGHTEPVILKDRSGEIGIYMLPFIKPVSIKRFFEDREIETYTDALRVAIDEMHVDENRRNILVAHQFVTGASRSDSEDISIGGLDNVDASVFECFDYVALGHIHGPQNISEKIRYCGTPLKYSFSEVNHIKTVTVAEIKEKGSIEIREIPLEPKHNMAEIRGTYNELMLKSFYENTTLPEDYVRITLTDEDDIIDARTKLRSVYQNLMVLDYDNTRTRHSSEITGAENVERKSPLQLFEELFELQNGIPMSEEQRSFMINLMELNTEDEI